MPIVQTSSTEHPDLWRALKGGSNHFSVVTAFTARTCPISDIWGGYLYIPHFDFEHKNVLSAFHDTLKRIEAVGTGTMYDENAGALLCCFLNSHLIRFSLTAANLIYTGDVSRLSENPWTVVWAKSPWSRLWQSWGTATVRTLSNTTDGLQGYGEENHSFLKEVSRDYDPDRLFQRECTGGFKPGIYTKREHGTIPFIPLSTSFR